MNHIERAALLIGKVFGVFDAVSAGTPKAIDIAKALVNAGWHDGPITEPEDANIDQEWLDRAVLDAADWFESSEYPESVERAQQLFDAVRARREAQQ